LRIEKEISRLIILTISRGVKIMTDKIQEVLFGSIVTESLQEGYKNHLTKWKEVNLSMESEAGLDSIELPGVTYKGKVLEAVSIRYTGRGRRVKLARYLCGKIAFRPDKIERIDLILLYDNFLHIQELAEKDENFKLKFGSDLESLALLLKSFRLKRNTTGLEVRKLGAQMKEKLSKFILPERNLDQYSSQVGKSYILKPALPSGIPLKNLKPKAYIGKGYTDQGTARNAAEDGSPSWQEVASSRIPGEPDEEET